MVPPVTPLATPLTLVRAACLWSLTKESALLSCSGLAADGNRLGDTYIIGRVDGTNHAGLAMIVLVLCAVEGDRLGVLDGQCKGGLAGDLARLAKLESRVESAIGLASSAAASSSGSDGMVLGWLVIMDRVDESLAYSGNPNKLDCVTNVGGDGSGIKDPQSTCAHLDLVGGSIGGRNVSRNSNDGLGEMHGLEVVYIIVSTGERERQLNSWKEVLEIKLSCS
jgi:hypothetical protein